MKGFKNVIFVAVFFILAGVAAYGLEKLFVSLLPSDAVGSLVKVYDIGIHALSFNFNICGVLGLIASYFLVTYIINK